MYQRPIMLVPISGTTARPSLFGSSIRQSVGFHPTLAGGYWIGQTPQDWYRRAKESLAKFDALLTRTAKIANKTERDNILTWVGTAAVEDSPAYRYATVKRDLEGDVEAYTPPNVNAYQVERRQNRIKKLEDYNKEFEAKVSNAETVYGKLPEPTVIERERIVTPPGVPGGPTTDWTLPLLVGGGAVAVAVAVTLLAGGKG